MLPHPATVFPEKQCGLAHLSAKVSLFLNGKRTLFFFPLPYLKQLKALWREKIRFLLYTDLILKVNKQTQSKRKKEERMVRRRRGRSRRRRGSRKRRRRSRRMGNRMDRLHHKHIQETRDCTGTMIFSIKAFLPQLLRMLSAVAYGCHSLQNQPHLQ